MTEKLEITEKRFDEINEKLTDINVINDQEQYKSLMKELKNLTPIIEKYRMYKTARSDFEEAEQMLSDGGLDKDFKEIVQEQYENNKKLMDEYTDELKILLLPKDPDDDRNVIIEIRGGAGGEEAALFANSMFRMYSMYAQTKGWKTEVISSNPTELGGYKEISFSVEGEGVYAKLKYESGVHRVQRVPETEAQGRIQTSTITVAVLPEVEEVDVEINPADLEFQTYRSSGAGGQHINKTSSAIRITHIPTGIVIYSQTEKSQIQNKAKAFALLRTKLYDLEQQKAHDAEAELRKSQVGTGDRSEKIRTYNFPQGRVTDHRIGLTLYKLDKIMNGDIQELLDNLIAADQAAKLSKLQEMER